MASKSNKISTISENIKKARKKKGYSINQGNGCFVCGKQGNSSYPWTKTCSLEHQKEYKKVVNRVISKERHVLVKKLLSEYRARGDIDG